MTDRKRGSSTGKPIPWEQCVSYLVAQEAGRQVCITGPGPPDVIAPSELLWKPHSSGSQTDLQIKFGYGAQGDPRKGPGTRPRVTGPVVRCVPPVLLADLFRRSSRIRLSIRDGVVRMFVNRATLAHTSHAGKNGFNSNRSWVPLMAFHANGETLGPWYSSSA
jgi:hypothetical protein